MTPRIYVDEPLSRGREVALPESGSHHVSRVLRLREGDAVTLFDGNGGEWKGILSGRAKARAVEWMDVEREAPLAITLVQGVSSGERMDYTIQKAVELGIAAIQPILTKKGVVKLEGKRAEARVEHWRRVAIAACEQCGRNRIPEVRPLLEFSLYLRDMKMEGPRLLLSAYGRSIREVEVQREATLAAGPEAGFAPEEQAALERAGFVKASLGPRVLRTETAALAALAALNALRGDF
jgi:16S rRNA (uracil1498-N3)-methyltransferase